MSKKNWTWKLTFIENGQTVGYLCWLITINQHNTLKRTLRSTSRSSRDFEKRFSPEEVHDQLLEQKLLSSSIFLNTGVLLRREKKDLVQSRFFIFRLNSTVSFFLIWSCIFNLLFNTFNFFLNWNVVVSRFQVSFLQKKMWSSFIVEFMFKTTYFSSRKRSVAVILSLFG